jgi:LuxR family transcriptional regulator, maltose regulon positive regulatory protein
VARVQVQLLGAAKIAIGAKSLLLRPNKRCQLLAYLAYQGGWVSREHLQYLFWSDSPPEVARGNLRQLLFRVSAMDIGKDLTTEHYRLKWEVKTDVAAFQAATEQKQWQEAIKHYGGMLLGGLEGDEVNEFSNWLSLERERLHQSWRGAVLSRAEELVASALYLEAAELLKSLLEGDEFDDEALKRYMQTTWQAGERTQALDAYQAFAKRLRQELDLSPTAELEQLAEHIRTVALPSEARENPTPVQPTIQSVAIEDKHPGPPTPTFPSLANAFVGRDFELDDVTERLLNPDCRLLTLVGMGGMGKTSLAVKTAEQLAAKYPHGVYFVGLDALNTASLIPSTIADSLKLALRGQDEPLAQLVRFIGEKDMLLVLDNFEHLLEGATVVLTLLYGCPKLKLLVTSRERLNLEEEWLLNVEGLSYPQDETLSVEESLYFDAVNLFVQRARRVRGEFILTREDLPALLDVCRLVEGSPLGLELAAAWVRLMPLQEIAEEIKGNFDFLVSSSRNKTERHRSLRAVFEHSWQLLTPKEQEVLRKLSVFVGGFSKEAAKQVVGAPLPILAALVDKSLLRMSPTERYDRHALVYQYSREKLAEESEEKELAEAKHAAYYLQLLREQADLFDGAKRKAARRVLEADYSNIRSSWDWALAQKRQDLIRQTAFELADFFEGHRQDGAETFARAAAALDEPSPAQPAALGYVLLGGVMQQRSLGYSPKKTKALSERAVALLEKLEDDYGLARGLCELADDEAALGDHAKAQELLSNALALARRAGEPRLIGRILTLRSLQNRETASFQEAKAFMEGALSELGALGNSNHQALLLLIYGASLVYEGQVDEGEACLKESLRLSDELGGEQDFRVYIFLDLARAAHKRTAYEGAEELLREAQLEAERRNLKRPEVEILWLLGRVKAAQGIFAEARAHFARCLRLAWEEGQEGFVATALVYLAECFALQDQAQRAVELLAVAGRQTLDKREQGEMEPLLAKLKSQSNPKDFKKAEARGGAMSLEDAVSQVLAESYDEVRLMSQLQAHPYSKAVAPFSLITTKLMAPRLPHHAVERPQLQQQLENALGAKLILVCAPAGAGKSTLLGGWLQGLERPSAWLSLDEGDNDLERFLLYVVSALQQVEPGLGKGLQEVLSHQSSVQVESIIIRLINDINDFNQPFVLVLDDYHIIRNEQVHDAVEFLLDHLPPQLCLVIATRADPPLALARLRVRGQLLELRDESLRFSLQETTTFLNDGLNLELSPAAIARLDERTEGWVAGLQLAALSLQGREDKEAFITQFAGSHRHLADYLVTEVLNQQSEEVRRFLQRTSVLGRFTASLCQEVSGQSMSQTFLEKLQAAHLFLIPLDDKGLWYRYHHLFAEFLHHRLVEAEAEVVPDLHRRASEWFEKEGWSDEAIHHALLANDFARAGQLVENIAFTLGVFWNNAQLIKYVSRLPLELLATLPRLCIYYGWALVNTGEVPQLASVLPIMEESASSGSHGVAVRACVLTLKAYQQVWHMDFAAGIELCREALKVLESAGTEPTSNEERWLRVAATNLIAYSYLHSDPSQAHAFYPLARETSQRFGNFVGIANGFARHGRLHHKFGRLHEALELLRQGLSTLEQQGRPALNVAESHLNLARLLYEWNRLDEAEKLVVQARQLNKLSGFPPPLGFELETSLLLHLAKGESEAAHTLLTQLDRLSATVKPGNLFHKGMFEVMAMEARLTLAANVPSLSHLLSEVGGWVRTRGLTVNDEVAYPHEGNYQVLARLLLVQGKADEALKVLERLAKAAQTGGRLDDLLRYTLLQALAHQALNQEKRALETLQEVLKLAESENYCRSFVDLGLPMYTLLSHLAQRQSTPYLSTLLEAFPVQKNADKPVPSTSVAAKPSIEPDWLEPLSEREKAVLRLLASGNSNKEIGKALALSPNTVRWYVSNLLGKLHVDSRLEAVSRARELGLL